MNIIIVKNHLMKSLKLILNTGSQTKTIQVYRIMSKLDILVVNGKYSFIKPVVLIVQY